MNSGSDVYKKAQMATPGRARKRITSQPPPWFIVGGLGAMVVFFVVGIGNDLEKSPQIIRDVNAPPVQQRRSYLEMAYDSKNNNVEDSTNRKQTQGTTNTESFAASSSSSSYASSFFFWGQQSNRLDTEISNDNGNKPLGKKKKKHKKHLQKPIPIIQDDDDSVPQAVDGSVIKAADALLCNEAVIDYVINATDMKDECGGLKKAYTKTCTDVEMEGEQSALPAARQAQRRLTKTDELRLSSLTTYKNPVVQWQLRLRRISDHLCQWLRSESTVENSEMDEFMAEEFPRTEQEELRIILEDDFVKTSEQYYDRGLNEAVAFELADRYLDQQEASSKEQASEASRPDAAVAKKAESPQEDDSKKKLNSPPASKKDSNAEKYAGDVLQLQRGSGSHPHSRAATGDNVQPDNNNSSNNSSNNKKDKQPTKGASEVPASSPVPFNNPNLDEMQTCCASIVNVFHENCSVDDEDEISDRRLFIVVAVIALCGLVKSLIRHFQIRWLPEAAGCILVGVASGWALTYYPHNDLSFDGPWFLRIMVPPIVFEAALSIDKRAFNRHVIPIIFYAVIGTLFATGLTAFLLHEGSKYFHGFCETIPVIEALTFGSLISSIDPIAVLSVLSNMGMTDTDTIYVIIFGESLLNDGVAIVLFQTLVHFLDVNMHVDSHAVGAAAIHFVVVAIGSLLVGLASGICCTVYYWLMHGCQTPLVEVLLFCCWALLPYYVCDGVEWSGIVAVVAAGFVMDVYVVGSHHPSLEEHEDMALEESSPAGVPPRTRRRRAIFATDGHLSKEAKTHVGFVTEIIATMMETAIFAYLGLFLFSSRYHWNTYHTTVAIAACCISRGIMIPCLSTLANWITKIQQVRSRCRYQKLPQQQDSVLSPSVHKENNPAGVIIDRKMQLVLWFAGLRGAMSFALVENIPLFDAETGMGTRLKSELKAMTSACIMFTVFVLGGLTFYMMENLGLAPAQNKSVGSQKLSISDMDTEMVSLLLKKEDSSDYELDTSSSRGAYDYEETFEMREVPNAKSPANGKKNFRQRSQAS